MEGRGGVSAWDASRNKKGFLLHQRCAGEDLKPANALIVTSHSVPAAGARKQASIASAQRRLDWSEPALDTRG